MNNLLKYILRQNGKAICKVLNLLILNNNGSFFSFTNLYNEKISSYIKKYTFIGNYNGNCIRKKYCEIVDKIKRLNVFTYKVKDENVKTIVNKKKKFVEQDELISITTNFGSNKLFITNFVKIAVLEETPNSLVFCMTTCGENIVNGYYRFVLNYNEEKQEIQLKYSNVQSFTNLALRLFTLFNEQSYIDTCKKDVMDTINYLLQDKVFTINNVKYSYE